MKQDILKGHLFLLIIILFSLSSGLIDGFIPDSIEGIIHQPIFLGIPVILYIILRKKRTWLEH